MFSLEDVEAWARDGVEGYGCYGEVEGCEADLGVAEVLVFEDALVNEDLVLLDSYIFFGRCKRRTYDRSGTCAIEARSEPEPPTQA